MHDKKRVLSHYRRIRSRALLQKYSENFTALTITEYSTRKRQNWQKWLRYYVAWNQSPFQFRWYSWQNQPRQIWKRSACLTCFFFCLTHSEIAKPPRDTLSWFTLLCALPRPSPNNFLKLRNCSKLRFKKFQKSINFSL